MSTPASAARPVPTMIDIGVANPSAHGHAMMRTATAFTRPCARRGSGPQIAHTTNVAMAISTTAGTNQDDTRSARRWIGARVRWASLTMWTICASSVSLPTRSARMTKPPVPFTVPPMTRLPGVFSTGIDSPVTIDSSTALRPSRATPSTGIFSPGRMRRRSPGTTLSSGTSSSRPASARRRATRGASASRARIAPPVLLLARSSITCPNSTRTVIAAAVSK